MPRDAGAGRPDDLSDFSEIDAVLEVPASANLDGHEELKRSTRCSDLRQMIRDRGPMPVAEAVDYAIQAARMVAAAHARGITHGQVCPGNLVLEGTGSLRLLDRAASAIAEPKDEFLAPEQLGNAVRVDHRTDIYSLGCTLYFLLTAHEPFPAEPVAKHPAVPDEREVPPLQAGRPDVPLALELCYQKMTKKRPADRPGSMSEVIELLLASRIKSDMLPANGGPPARLRPGPTIAGDREPRPAGPRRGAAEPSIFARREEQHRGHAFPLLAAAGIGCAALVGVAIWRRPVAVVDQVHTPPANRKDVHRKNALPVARPEREPVEAITLFDGTSNRGWTLCNRVPLPLANIQADGLNPHGTGSYLVVYDQKLDDFVLDFDYKLSAGCNSGVFLRVSDLNDPVQTGIEVALDDVRHGDDRDTGGFYRLLAPKIFAQKPDGEWNHMTVTALGPSLAVSLNGTDVCSINLDDWTVPGRRPDGSLIHASDRAVARNARSGYLGFQDLGSNCWFKNIVLKHKRARTRD
jgi:hypothetical protein